MTTCSGPTCPRAFICSSRLRPQATVYHCVDEHSAFPGLIDPQTVRAYDDALTRRADLVITTAASLCEERRPLNPRTFHVPNAADVDHFERAYREPLPEPADLEPIARPRLGIVGVHNARLDLEALRALSAAGPDWRLVLIGPYVRGELSAQEVEAIPRVHSSGREAAGGTARLSAGARRGPDPLPAERAHPAHVSPSSSSNTWRPGSRWSPRPFPPWSPIAT